MQESSTAKPKANREKRADARPPETILFVDDELHILSALERQLRNRFRVRTAAGPFEGLRALEGDGPFAVVVSDMSMPGMDGFQFLEKVRSQSPDTARIILTGQVDLPTVIKAVNTGDILRFLQKPCAPEALVESLEAGLKHYAWIAGQRRLAEAAQLGRAEILDELDREIDISNAAVACVETALEQSESRFRATFDGTPVGICLLASDGRIVEANDSLQRMLGFSREELQDVRLADWANREDRRQVDDCLESLMDGNRERCQFVGSYRRDDGRTGCVRVTICRSPIANREFLAIAMVEDITESWRVEEHFLHGQRMEALGRFAGGVAHDFINLLTVIRGSVDLAAKLWPEVDHNLCLARQATDRATALVDQLLMFSHQQFIIPKVTDLDAVVAEFEEMLRRLAGSDIDLVVQVGAGGASVLADRTQLEQVLLNLALNARDAMPRGGCLKIKTEIASLNLPLAEDAALESGEYLVLTVTDNGTGMTPEVRSRIFEPFFTTKEPERGAGLGLSTVFGIVRQYGGQISVDSDVGKGTTFTIYFPRERAAVPTPNTMTAKIPVCGIETILVVEDDELLRSLVCEILEGNGYRVLSAPSGERACELVRQTNHPIQLLVTDVVMSGMGGYAMAQRVEAAQPGTKVLFVSGNNQKAETGDGAFLKKPFTPGELIRMVRTVLDGDRKQESKESPRSAGITD